MMRMAFLVALAALAFMPAAQAADPAMPPAIEKCVRDNAAGVEAAISDLNQGVDFLVGNLCAEPIAAEQARQNKENSDRQAAHWKAMCDAEKAAARVKPDAKDPMTNLCSSMRIGFLTEPNGGEDGEDTYISLAGGAKPPAATALAARLLLDLRLAHGKPGGR